VGRVWRCPSQIGNACQTYWEDLCGSWCNPLSGMPRTREILQDQPSTLPFSGDEEGSGNEADPETGSGTEFDMEEPEVSDFVNQPNVNLKLKLSDEGLFPHENVL
ncbi:hypothetical protein L345_07259, partial [Ophiophagus hannah]